MPAPSRIGLTGGLTARLAARPRLHPTRPGVHRTTPGARHDSQHQVNACFPVRPRGHPLGGVEPHAIPPVDVIDADDHRIRIEVGTLGTRSPISPTRSACAPRSVSRSVASSSRRSGRSSRSNRSSRAPGSLPVGGPSSRGIPARRDEPVRVRHRRRSVVSSVGAAADGSPRCRPVPGPDGSPRRPVGRAPPRTARRRPIGQDRPADRSDTDRRDHASTERPPASTTSAVSRSVRATSSRSAPVAWSSGSRTPTRHRRRPAVTCTPRPSGPRPVTPGIANCDGVRRRPTMQSTIRSASRCRRRPMRSRRRRHSSARAWRPSAPWSWRSCSARRCSRSSRSSVPLASFATWVVGVVGVVRRRARARRSARAADARLRATAARSSPPRRRPAPRSKSGAGRADRRRAR